VKRIKIGIKSWEENKKEWFSLNFVRSLPLTLRRAQGERGVVRVRTSSEHEPRSFAGQHTKGRYLRKQLSTLPT
jgi:hypothetical protein